MKKLILFSLFLGVLACSKNDSPQPRSLEQQVDALLMADKYEDALTLLSSKKESPETLKLLETTYLNYGLFLEYRDSNETNMREKMNKALKQFVEVLKINIANQKAISEVDQIMGIYATFPDRKPDAEIMKDLEDLGFRY